MIQLLRSGPDRTGLVGGEEPMAGVDLLWVRKHGAEKDFGGGGGGGGEETDSKENFRNHCRVPRCVATISLLRVLN